MMFMKLMLTAETEDLMRRPDDFALLALIARRCRGNGTAFIGDYKTVGLTPRRYRTAKKRLARDRLATFKGTNRGTKAWLCNSRVFDVVYFNGDKMNDKPEASEGQTVDAGKTTIKDKSKKKNKSSNGDYSEGFLAFWSAYPLKRNKQAAWRAWKRQKCEGISERVVDSVGVHVGSKDWLKEDGAFIPHPATFINGHGWEDVVEVEDFQKKNGGEPRSRRLGADNPPRPADAGHPSGGGEVGGVPEMGGSDE